MFTYFLDRILVPLSRTTYCKKDLKGDQCEKVQPRRILRPWDWWTISSADHRRDQEDWKDSTTTSETLFEYYIQLDPTYLLSVLAPGNILWDWKTRERLILKERCIFLFGSGRTSRLYFLQPASFLDKFILNFVFSTKIAPEERPSVPMFPLQPRVFKLLPPVTENLVDNENQLAIAKENPPLEPENLPTIAANSPTI